MLARRSDEDHLTTATQVAHRGLLALIRALDSGGETALHRAARTIAGWPGVCSATIKVLADQVGRSPIRVHAGTASRAHEGVADLQLALRDRDVLIGTLEVTFDDAEFVAPEVPRLCEVAALLLSGVAARVRTETMLLDAQSYEVAGRIAAGLVHDFNNMLTGILGNAAIVQMLLADDDRASVPVARIEAAATSAAHLTRALLSFVRGSIDRSPLAINGLVIATQRMVARSLRDGVLVTLDLAPDVPIVEGEQLLLQQALMNLVLNAAEAIEGDGSIVIRTRCVRTLPPTARGEARMTATYAALSVIDSGVGISPGNLGQMFRPFFSTKDGAGTGLGLASVAQVARRHGGAVGVESPPGRGATFTIYLPGA